MGLMARPLPGQPALLLGVCLVRLEPCADWLLTFTLLRIEDARLAVAAAPVLLLVQMALLPLWLGIFPGSDPAGILRTGSMLEASVGWIVMPLSLALLTEWLARRVVSVHRGLTLTARFPVPLLMGSVFLIAAAHIPSRKHCVVRSGYGDGGVCPVCRPGPVPGRLRGATARTGSGTTPEGTLQRPHARLFRGVAASAGVAGGLRVDGCGHRLAVGGRAENNAWIPLVGRLAPHSGVGQGRLSQA